MTNSALTTGNGVVLVLITGIVGQKDKGKTANLINSILAGAKKKISIIDLKNLSNLDSTRVKRYLDELRGNNTEILIIKIDFEDLYVGFLECICFDIIIFTDKADDINKNNIDNFRESMHKAFSMLKENGIAIVNSDDNEFIHFLEGIKHYIITYGFNLKASITASSIGDLVIKDSFMCCLQRTIHSRNGKLIEPQEFKVRADLDGINPYSVLAAATFVLINHADFNSDI